MAEDLKLKINPIPQCNHGYNLRAYYPKEWKTIREEQLKIYNYKCAICGDTEKKLHCHEDWEIDNKKHIQKLKGLKIICEYCHHCIHWGRLQMIDNTGKLIEAVSEHFLKINNCSREIFVKHKNDVLNTFYKNRRILYDLDLGEYEPPLITQINVNYKISLPRFKKHLKLNNVLEEFVNHPPFIKHFKKEIISMLVEAGKYGQGYRILYFFMFDNINHKLSKDFFKELFLACFHDEYGHIPRMYYFKQIGFSKFNTFFLTAIFPENSKESNNFISLIEKSYEYEFEFLTWLINHKTIISKLNIDDINNAYKLLLVGKNSVKKKEIATIKNSVLYSKYLLLNC